MRVQRLYTDTSVFGGCFDEEFAAPSKRLFRLIEEGRFRLILSAMTTQELEGAPEEVRQVLANVRTGSVEFHDISDEMVQLRDAYLAAGVLGEGSSADALHVAAATVVQADMIVSWNFKHIVNYNRIRGFNAVNQMNGYKPLEIYSPLEVAGHETEDV